MNPESIPHPGKMGPALPLAVTGLAVFQAIPSLTEAWRVDLYARGALPAFGIWLAAQAWLFFRQRAASGGPNVVWLAVALGLAGAGSMTGLRVLHHLSLTAAVPGLVGLKSGGLITTAAASAWLPATGWLVSHWLAGGLAGWERPVFCLMMMLPLVLSRHASTCNATEPDPSHET